MLSTASSRLLAVVGDPVAHSISPAIHNSAFAALAVDAVYVAMRVPAAELDTVAKSLRILAVAGNVTVPHKVAFARLVDRSSERASRLDAVNTFWVEDGALVGDNTDVDGVLASTTDMAGPWLVLGTGGAARAAAEAARLRDVPLRVRSRSAARARAFVEWASSHGHPDVRESVDGEGVGVLINATPCGLRPGDRPPTRPDDLDKASAVVDMTYARGGTALVKVARKVGLPAVDGRVMLVAQAVASFERFFPGVAAPREIMMAAANRALD
ncbi:MAG TPA: hypothetical protein VGA22_09485 [Gemmatimonadales bacterium]|jgi:shikimate dehydrogenase